MKCAFFQGSTEHEMPSFMHMMYYVHIVSHFDSSSQWNPCDKCVKKQGKKNDKGSVGRWRVRGSTKSKAPRQRKVSRGFNIKGSSSKGRWRPSVAMPSEGLSTIPPICRSCKMIVLQSLTRFAGAPFAQGSLLYWSAVCHLPTEPFYIRCHIGAFLFLQPASKPEQQRFQSKGRVRRSAYLL